jgi:L-threonylcarbamoyladenylate synthase
MKSSPPSSPTARLQASPEAVTRAGDLLRKGKLVAFPTETVYGLGASALDEHAVAAVFAAKARPQINPLIVHVLDLTRAEQFVEIGAMARRLAESFWPGALTLVLPRRESCAIAQLASAGLETVAIRAPAHPIARSLLAAADVPIAAPSANRSGRVSPTTADHVMEELEGNIDLVLDGGACPLGLESTIVGFADGSPVLLRKGAIAKGEIEAVIGAVAVPQGGGIAAPGMMKSHYAPSCGLRLEATDIGEHEALLAFGKSPLRTGGPVLNLSPAGELNEAAANLFRMLRQLDKAGAKAIAVMPIPNIGIGEAINDRLARAAAPRDGVSSHG